MEIPEEERLLEDIAELKVDSDRELDELEVIEM